MFEMLGSTDLSVSLSLQVESFALDSSPVALLFLLEDSQQFESLLDINNSGNRSFSSLNISLGNSDSETDDLGLSLAAAVQFDSSQGDLSCESNASRALGFVSGLAQSSDLKSEVLSMLSVDRDFPFEATCSLLLSLEELDLETVDSQMMSFCGEDLVSNLFYSGAGNDSSEVDDLSVALSSHSLGFGLLVFGLPLTDVAELC